jgi:hypothetical protein
MNTRGIFEATAVARVKGQRQINVIVRGWLVLYAVAWVGEGALRKWLAPSLSDVIYFGRDFLTLAALVLVVSAGVPHRKVARASAVLVASLLLGAFAAAQIFLTSQSLVVYALGVRDLLMPLLAMLLVYLSNHRVAAVSRFEVVLLAAAPVQAAIVILQATSPITSFWNDLGNDDAVLLLTSNEVARASGSFTSPAGLTAYVTLVVALTLARLLSEAPRHRRLLLASLVSCLVILLLGGSRGAILNATIIVVAALAWTFISARRISTALRLLAAGVASFYASKLVTRLFPSAFDAFVERAETASRSENSGSRIMGNMLGYWDASSTPSGDGIGGHLLAGQAAGSTLGWVESELSRWVLEMGALGLVLVVARQGCALLLIVATWRRSASTRDPLAWLMSAALVPPLLYGAVSSTPTQQGFTILALAVLMASFGDPPADEETRAVERQGLLV